MSLRVGERAIYVGAICCGTVRRVAVRRFAATDRRGEQLGAFASERGALAAIIDANLAAAKSAAPKMMRASAGPSTT